MAKFQIPEFFIPKQKRQDAGCRQIGVLSGLAETDPEKATPGVATFRDSVSI
jgi:hypothetical protein